MYPKHGALSVKRNITILTAFEFLRRESEKQGTKEGHKQTKQDTKVKMVSCLNDSQVRLITTVVDIVGNTGKRQSVRAFIDQGSQASFVVSDLVRSLGAPKVKEINLAIQGFTLTTEHTQTSLHELRVLDCSGTYHTMNVIKKKALNLNIPTVSGVLERWRNRGIEISDAEGRCASDNIQLLIGADFANKFLHEKTEVNGEVAWRTSFGWVLLGVVSKTIRALCKIVCCQKRKRKP